MRPRGRPATSIVLDVNSPRPRRRAEPGLGGRLGGERDDDRERDRRHDERRRSGRPCSTMIPASAAGTTPVSRVHARKTSSSRDHRPRRSGSEAARGPRAAVRRRSSTASDGERREQVVRDVAQRQVRAEREEDEHHHHVRDRADERPASRARAPSASPSPSSSMLPDDQPREERAQVAAPAGRVDREEAAGDDRDRRRSQPTPARAGAVARDGAERTTPKATPRAVEIARSTTKSSSGSVSEASPLRTTREGEREHGAGRVVERGLGDDRLRDLGPQAGDGRTAGSGSPGRSARAPPRSAGRS